MRRQPDSRLQSGHTGDGDYGDTSSSDGIARSTGSGDSDRQAATRPVIRAPSSFISRVSTPDQPFASPRQVSSPFSPRTPVSERTIYDANGQSIHETYKWRPSTNTSPARSPPPVSPAIRTGSPRQRSNAQNVSNRPQTRNIPGHWAMGQESKVKILGIPKQCWTKDVYFSMSRFGTVVRVDMEVCSRDNNAWVVYQ